MRRAFVISLLLLPFLSPQAAHAGVPPSWKTPVTPFAIADNLFYVGSQDLASYLVVTPKGHILINANLDSSPPQIRASVESLGYRWSDIRILLNSQAHSDHMGGAAAILRETHARNMVMDGDDRVVETGGKADFLYPSVNVTPYAPAHVDQVLHDGDTVRLGGVTLTAHKTAGHTRGCTTWTLRAHVPGDPAGTFRNVVIVGGVSFWSEYHFVASPGHPASYPGIADDFERTFATLRSLPCDVFLGAHGGYFDLQTKLRQYGKVGLRAFIDRKGYRTFVDAAAETFRTELERQRVAVGK